MFQCYNGSRSHLYYIREPTNTWSRTCQAPGFVPVAVTTTDIQDDINDLFFRDPGEPHWVSGTNMRWVWITGLFLVLKIQRNKNYIYTPITLLLSQ